jgi:hypothetical protein
MSQAGRVFSDSVTEGGGSHRLYPVAIHQCHLAATELYPAMAFETLQVSRHDFPRGSKLDGDILVSDLLNAIAVEFE